MTPTQLQLQIDLCRAEEAQHPHNPDLADYWATLRRAAAVLLARCSKAKGEAS